MRKEKIPFKCKMRGLFQATARQSDPNWCKYGLNKKPLRLCAFCPKASFSKYYYDLMAKLERGSEE